MIDRASRDVAVKVLREFVSGKITNDEFVARFPRRDRGDDAALWGTFYFVWGLFSDLRVHKLIGRNAPTPDNRARLERCCLFLLKATSTLAGLRRRVP